MKHTLTYGDLGDYIIKRRKADKTDQTMRNSSNAWNKFAKLLPDLAATAISDEATDKMVTRFEEAAGDQLSPATITNYTHSFRRVLAAFQRSVDATGSREVPVPQPAATSQTSTALTYGHMREYAIALQDEDPDYDQPKRWLTAYDSVVKRLPDAADMTIDPERTEQIMAQFSEAATNLRPGTIGTYQSSFRQAVRNYCEVVNVDYVEIDPDERRRRAAAKRHALTEPEPKPVETELPAVTDPSVDAEPEVAETEEAVELAEYSFLLRHRIAIAVPLPDDLTQAEADRFSRWIGSFVIDGN